MEKEEESTTRFGKRIRSVHAAGDKSERSTEVIMSCSGASPVNQGCVVLDPEAKEFVSEQAEDTTTELPQRIPKMRDKGLSITNTTTGVYHAEGRSQDQGRQGLNITPLLRFMIKLNNICLLYTSP